MVKGRILGIFGSRSLGGARVRDIIQAEVNRLHPAIIATAAEPDGVCRTAREYARANVIPTLLYFREDARAGGKYEARTIKLLGIVDDMLFVWDGQSNGTAGEMLMAEKMHVEYKLFTLQPQIEGLDILDIPDINEMIKEVQVTV